MSLANTRRGGGSSRTVRNRSKKAGRRSNRGGSVVFKHRGVDKHGFPEIESTTNPEQQKFLKKVFEHAYQNSHVQKRKIQKRKIQVQAKIDQKHERRRASEDLYRACLDYVVDGMGNNKEIHQLINDIYKSYSSRQNPKHYNPTLALLFKDYVRILEREKNRHSYGPVMQISNSSRRLNLDTLGSSSYRNEFLKIQTASSSKVRVSNPIKNKKKKATPRFLIELRRKNK